MPSLVRACAVALLVLAGCGGKGEPDPKIDAPLVTMEEVDDRFASLVPEGRVRVPYKPDGAIRGAAEPLVTIVEFSDFQCPFCGKFASTLDEVARAYPDDVRIVFMQFPLPMHPDAKIGAKAAIAAQSQQHFWAMHDYLFEHRTAMKDADVVAHAKALGLDAAKFEADLAAPETEKRLEWEQAIGRMVGVRGTPSFFVNGKFMSGALEAGALQQAIEEERKLAQSLIEAGAERKAVYAHIMRAAEPTGTEARPAEPKPQPPADPEAAAEPPPAEAPPP